LKITGEFSSGNVVGKQDPKGKDEKKEKRNTDEIEEK
jgi:hypothetical protein